jgi:hypothetical protein
VRAALPVLVLTSLLSACERRRPAGDDDTTPQDDDSAVDDDTTADDDTTTDDDTTADGDDDSTPAPQAPVITAIDACEVVLLSQPWGQFTFTVADADGDLISPVPYEVRINGGPAVRAFEHEADLGHGGNIIHRDQVGGPGLDRGTIALWEFRVTDVAAHTGPWAGMKWQIPFEDGQDPCD